MAKITLHGQVFQTNGELPGTGVPAHGFRLVNKDLKDVTLHDCAGKKKILNIFPSIDTPVCAASVRKFNESVAAQKNAVVLCISADLPFAQARFCGAEGIENVMMLSMMRDKNFARDYGVLIENGPLAGLAARAVVVLDANNVVRYTQLVEEIGQEPDYAAALKALG